MTGLTSDLSLHPCRGQAHATWSKASITNPIVSIDSLVGSWPPSEQYTPVRQGTLQGLEITSQEQVECQLFFGQDWSFIAQMDSEI